MIWRIQKHMFKHCVLEVWNVLGIVGCVAAGPPQYPSGDIGARKTRKTRPEDLRKTFWGTEQKRMAQFGETALKKTLPGEC